MLRSLITLVALTLTLVPAAHAQEPASPSVVVKSLVDQTQDLASFNLPIGTWSTKGLPTQQIKGMRRDQVLFYGQSLATPRQILAPIEEALRADGYQSRLDCTDRICGGYEFQKNIDALPASERPFALFDFVAQSYIKQDRAVFLLASRAGNDLVLYRVDVGPHTSQPIEITPPSVPQTPTDTTSFIILDGLIFDVGQKSLDIKDDTAINLLVKRLTSDPSARIMLVGHSDNRGALETNIALSRARADQVRQVLIDTYNIDAARIDAAGIGFLAPRASNTTAEGRLKNRRVEAVFLQP